MHYAGFWIRVVAAIVDAIALWIVWSLILLVLPADPMAPPPENQDFEAWIEYASSLISPRQMIVYSLIVWAYFAFQESSSSAGHPRQADDGHSRLDRERGTAEPPDGLASRLAGLLPSVAALAGTGVSSLVA